MPDLLILVKRRTASPITGLGLVPRRAEGLFGEQPRTYLWDVRTDSKIAPLSGGNGLPVERARLTGAVLICP